VKDYASVEYKQPASSILNRDNVGIVVKFALKNNTQIEFIVATTHLLYNPKRDDVRLAQTQVLLTEIDRLAYDNKKTYVHYITLNSCYFYYSYHILKNL